MDSVLADIYRGGSNRYHLAREVSERPKIVLDSAFRVALLDGICGAHLGSFINRGSTVHKSDRGEALIEGYLPENIARWKLDWRHEVVPERGLFARREAYDVRGRISPVLFARPRIHNGL